MVEHFFAGQKIEQHKSSEKIVTKEKKGFRKIRSGTPTHRGGVEKKN